MKPVVFILGAGASIPYGFPSGATLTSHIHRAIHRRMGDVPSHMWKLREFLVKTRMHKEEIVEQFASALADSRINSIDAFLARRKNLNLGSEIVSIGYDSIAFSLIPYEMPDAIAYPTDHRTDWFGYFWNFLINRSRTRAELEANLERYSFFTFNYDRSFEESLTRAYASTFATSVPESKKRLEKFYPIHLYGSLGLYQGFNPGSRNYDPNVKDEEWNGVREQLRIIDDHRDTRDDLNPFHALQKKLHFAKRVVFLGFGFDAINCRRIALNQIISRPDHHIKQVIGTTLGMTKIEIARAKEEYLGAEFDDYELDCCGLLRQFPIL